MTEIDAIAQLLDTLGDYVCNQDENAYITRETVLQAMMVIQAMSIKIQTTMDLLRDVMMLGRK